MNKINLNNENYYEKKGSEEKMKKKQIKMDKFDLFVIATSMFVLGMLVQKIAIYGLNCLTTIYRV